MRNARVEVSLELLPTIAPLLRDHGLTIIGIQNARAAQAIRLLVEGFALPDACEGATPLDAPLVTLTCTQEVYGQQRLVKISEIRLARPDRQGLAA